MRPQTPILAAVSAWCAWGARDLLFAWRSSPYDHLGWIAFALWLTPLALAAVRGGGGEPRLWPSFAAVVLAFVAVVGSVNAIAYVALALALAAFIAPGARWAAWVACAAAWWPAFGYVAKALPASALPGLRGLVAALGAAVLISARRPAAKESP